MTGRGVADYVLQTSRSRTIEQLPQPLGRPASVRPEDLISPQAEKDWQYWREKYASSAEAFANEELRRVMSDTVGAIVVSEDGSIAAGVSR